MKFEKLFPVVLQDAHDVVLMQNQQRVRAGYTKEAAEQEVAWRNALAAWMDTWVHNGVRWHALDLHSLLYLRAELC